MNDITIKCAYPIKICFTIWMEKRKEKEDHVTQEIGF